MLLERRAINGLRARESFLRPWPEALISSALVKPDEFLPCVLWGLASKESKTQCRHYLILLGNMHVRLGGAGVVTTQPILQMGELK